jgi:Golgi SNAP receptor complex protein 2
MDDLVLRETPAQREVWKRKIQELRADAESLRRLGEDHDRKMNANVRHQRERDELLRRRKQRNSTHSNTDERDMENLADEGKSLQQSQYMVNDLLGSGEASLNALTEQRQKLGGITGMLMNIGNRLNLSQSTMRIIERRDVTDLYLVFGGMVVTCIVFYLVWFVEW